MFNYCLKIQYDGSNYAGWQIQENAVTIQQLISKAVKTITKEDVNIIGSGRTDSGVHAFGQIANFNSIKELDLFRFQHSLNGILPDDISIIEIKKVDKDFHARFSAKRRSYLYFISKFKTPFFNRYTNFINNPPNINVLNKLSRSLKGEYDFTSFCRKNTDTKNKICNVFDIHWKETKGIIIFFIEADRFLHGMVRTIVGTLINVVINENPEKELKRILEAKDREEAGEAVPAKGLFLYKVKY